MDFNKLTQKSQEAFQAAQAICMRRGHLEVDGEHLLLALLQQESGSCAVPAAHGRGRTGRHGREALAVVGGIARGLGQLVHLHLGDERALWPAEATERATAVAYPLRYRCEPLGRFHPEAKLNVVGW